MQVIKYIRNKLCKLSFAEFVTTETMRENSLGLSEFAHGKLFSLTDATKMLSNFLQYGPELSTGYQIL